MAILRQVFLLANYGRYVWRGVFSTQRPHEMLLFRGLQKANREREGVQCFWGEMRVLAVSGVPRGVEGDGRGSVGRSAAAVHFSSITICLKAYPDTNREFSAIFFLAAL